MISVGILIFAQPKHVATILPRLFFFQVIFEPPDGGANFSTTILETKLLVKVE